MCIKESIEKFFEYSLSILYIGNYFKHSLLISYQEKLFKMYI